MKWNLNAGFRLRSDYSESTRQKWIAKHAADREPYLLSSTREEAQGSFGTALAVLFQHTPPRFYFNSREQELLEAALTGLSDDEAADALCVSHAAIRKRWESLYAKVISAAPTLLGETASLPARRGPEKRRRLIAYLQAHPEELRPVLALKVITAFPTQIINKSLLPIGAGSNSKRRIATLTPQPQAVRTGERLLTPGIVSREAACRIVTETLQTEL